MSVEPRTSSRRQVLEGALVLGDVGALVVAGCVVDIPLGFEQVGRPTVLVSGYSRVIGARMIPSRQSPDLLAGQSAVIGGWGRVPRALVWDNESGIGQRRAGRPQLTESMNAFRVCPGAVPAYDLDPWMRR